MRGDSGPRLPSAGVAPLRSRPAELRRKAIHASTAAAAIAVWLLPKPAAVTLLATAAVVAIVVEVTRVRVRCVRYRFLKLTRPLLRRRERRGVAGATYMAIAYLGAAAFFPRPVAVAAILYTALGDAAASMVGVHWGRRRLSNGKSWEGAGAAFLVDLAVGLAVPGIATAAAVAGAAAATLLELASLPPDDNVWATLGGGSALWATMLLASGTV